MGKGEKRHETQERKERKGTRKRCGEYFSVRFNIRNKMKHTETNGEGDGDGRGENESLNS